MMSYKDKSEDELHNAVNSYGEIESFDFSGKEQLFADLVYAWRKRTKFQRLTISHCRLPQEIIIPDCRNLAIGNSDLAKVDFSNVLLNDSFFSTCHMIGANFKGADIGNCSFMGCGMTDTRFDLVKNMPTASFELCEGVIDAGMDYRGYRFVAFHNNRNSYMINAGCRWYRRTDAIEHWFDPGYMPSMESVDNMQECIYITQSKVLYIDKIANALGWTHNFVVQSQQNDEGYYFTEDQE